jgi:hypothetical protein
MKLRQKNKRKQALDAFASVAKTWSEWHLGKKVSKTAAKGASKAAKIKPQGDGKGKRLRIAGVAALLAGVGAAVTKKLKGGKAEPLYTPPGPAPDMPSPPPSPVVVEDLTPDSPAEPAPPPESTKDAVQPEDLMSDTASESEAEADTPDEAPTAADTDAEAGSPEPESSETS